MISDLEQLKRRKYYIARAGSDAVLGPFSLDELKDLARDRGIDGTCQVTPEGEENWHPLDYTLLWQHIQPRSRFLADEMAEIGKAPSPFKHHRRNDFLKLAFFGNLFLFVFAYSFVVLTPISLMCLAALFVMFNVASFWMMFFVLKD